MVESVPVREASHLAGDVDLYAVVNVLVLEEQRRKKANQKSRLLPFRPEQGQKMFNDLLKKQMRGNRQMTSYEA